MIRNIVFDMGMVLMDYHPLTACREVAPDEESALKLKAALFDNPEWFRLDDGTLLLEELARRAQACLAEEELRPLIRRLAEGIPENILSPIPGMAETVDWVMEAGYRVYLLSNASLEVSRRRDMIPRIDKFDGVIFSADEKAVKPNPTLYRRLTDRFSLVPQECFFIDDNADNVQGARNLGWSAYLFDGDIPALRRALEGLKKSNA